MSNIELLNNYNLFRETEDKTNLNYNIDEQIKLGQKVNMGARIYLFDYFHNIPPKKNIDTFIQILKDCEAYIAGGSILSIIHDNYKFNDIDIYVNRKNSIKIIDFLLNTNADEERNLVKITEEINFASSYENTFFKKNGLLFRLNFKYENMYDSKIKKNIDLLVIEDSRNIYDVIMNFDLSFCSVFLKYTNQQNYFGGNIDNAINKTGVLNKEYAEKYLFNTLIKRRINKYLDKGYKIKFLSKINSISKSLRIVSNNTVIYFLIKNMYFNVKKINDFLNYNDLKDYDILYYFSSLNYDKNEFEQNAKNFCKDYLGNENYYIAFIYNCFQINFFTTERSNVLEYSMQTEKLLDLLRLYDEYKLEIDTKYNLLSEEFKQIKIDMINLTLEKFNKLINKNITKFTEYFANILNLTEIYEYLFSKKKYELLMKVKEKFDEKYKWIFNKELLIANEYNIINSYITKYYIDKKVINNLDVYLINENKNIVFNVFEKQTNFNDYLIFITSFQDSSSNINYKSYAIKFNEFITNIKFFVKCENLDNLLNVTPQDTEFFEWYYKLSVPQIFGLSFSEIIINLSQYIYSEKKNNIFYLYNLINIENISSVEAISITSDNIATKNIFGDYVYLLSEKHCQGRTYDDLIFNLISDQDIYYDMEKEIFYNKDGNQLNQNDFFYEDSYGNQYFFNTDFGKFYKKIKIGDTIYSSNRSLYQNYLENSRGELWKFDEDGQKYYETSKGIKIYDYNAKIKSETHGLLFERHKYIDVAYTIIKTTEDLENLLKQKIIKFDKDIGYYIFDDLLFHILTVNDNDNNMLKFVKEYDIVKNIQKNEYDSTIININIKTDNTRILRDEIIFSNDLPYSKNHFFISSNILPKIIDNSLLVYKTLAQVVYNISDERLKNINFDINDPIEIHNSAYSEDPWKYFDLEYLIELFGEDLELIRNDLPDYRIKELNSRSQINPNEIKELFMKYDILIKQIPIEKFNNFSLNSIIIDIIRQLPLNISLLNKLKNIKQDSESETFIKTINNILDLRETLENQINLIIDEYNEDYTEQNKCYLDDLSNYVYSITKFDMIFFNKMFNYEFTDVISDECEEDIRDINIKIIKLKLIDYMLSDYDFIIIQDIKKQTDIFNNIFQDIDIILKLTNIQFLKDNYESIKSNIKNIEYLSKIIKQQEIIDEEWPKSESDSDDESDIIYPRRLDFIEDSESDSESIDIPSIRQEEPDSD